MIQLNVVKRGEIKLDYILLVVGFVLLIKGADIFVDGASSISKKLGIPSVIVGLTIVSLGTSAPELAVSLISSLQGSNELAFGNVLGSNIFNTLIVLGVTTIIMPLVVKKSKIKTDFIVNILVTLLLLVLTFNSFFGGEGNVISRFDGIILIAICIAYTIYLIKSVKSGKRVEDVEDEVAMTNELEFSYLKNIFKLLIGVAGIVIGGNIVVDSAKAIALSWGMSDKLVGLTIVAMGTSLPELVTSAVAALKGENDIAVGNVLGSNIFNILLILGVSATINPISVATNLAIDTIILILVTLVIGGSILLSKKEEKKISKLEGVIYVSIYAGYLIYIIMRN